MPLLPVPVTLDVGFCTNLPAYARREPQKQTNLSPRGGGIWPGPLVMAGHRNFDRATSLGVHPSTLYSNGRQCCYYRRI